MVYEKYWEYIHCLSAITDYCSSWSLMAESQNYGKFTIQYTILELSVEFCNK